MGEHAGKISHSILVRRNFVSATKNTKRAALFDLDGTLIRKVEHQIPHGSTRWELAYENIPRMLSEADKGGFFIGIISNQLDLWACKKKFLRRLDEFLSRFEFQIIFIAAMRRDYFRKPLPGAFEYLQRMLGTRFGAESFYVGDAAGRKTQTTTDHSCCDIKFAYNCGLRFHTPEAFFCGRADESKLFLFDPRSYVSGSGVSPQCADKRVCVVFGKGKWSGKTFFARRHFQSHRIIRGGPIRKAQCARGRGVS